MSTYSVSRNALIPAAPAVIFPLINDFHEWTAWSPWESLDTNMRRSYSGSTSGPGARYEWQGNRRAGAGSMDILRTNEPSSLEMQVNFTKPFKTVNPLSFTLVPESTGTRVTWTMTGENRGVMALFSRFMSMDKMIGKDFEKGLASLATAVAARNGR
jgi:hypothetical protein